METYLAIEVQIRQAIQRLKEDEKPNVAVRAREYEVPREHLHASWNGRQSRKERIAPNRKLTEDQELGSCQYLNQLDEIGIPPRYNLIGQYANSILCRSHSDLQSPPP